MEELNKNQVINIRHELIEHMSISQIAKLFNVSYVSIWNIINNKTWV